MNKVDYFKKIIKIAFIFALVAFLTWKTVMCLQHYLKNPTYTTNRYVDQDKTEFPAITICPIYPDGYKKKILSNYGITDSRNYWKISTCHSNMTWSSNIAVNISEEDLFHNVTYQFRELVNKIYIRKYAHVSFLLRYTYSYRLH